VGSGGTLDLRGRDDHSTLRVGGEGQTALAGKGKGLDGRAIRLFWS
jgi:hypothetical protein